MILLYKYITHTNLMLLCHCLYYVLVWCSEIYLVCNGRCNINNRMQCQILASLQGVVYIWWQKSLWSINNPAVSRPALGLPRIHVEMLSLGLCTHLYLRGRQGSSCHILYIITNWQMTVAHSTLPLYKSVCKSDQWVWSQEIFLADVWLAWEAILGLLSSCHHSI